ncbi:pseudouridine synthase [Lutibacter citreus]|uniref:pseudouridine synthase n=1 Tax=Lutibacter citreus TaxID=2138210 RepID=UPI000DBE3B16|nr:pseudouridine synthase [Lutibacter citreus]
MHIEILFEDDYFVIVNKPNNVLVHNSYYARNIKEPTLLDLLKDELNQTLYPIHRLDRKTSGVIALSKKKETVAVFQELFNSNILKKEYFGIVRGYFEGNKIINTPVKNPDTKVYKEAETHGDILNKIELKIPVHPYDFSRYSLVKLTPFTGRMHQLRIHMNKVSHPIVGDTKYGDRFHNRMFEKEFNCGNLFLHAYSLNFKHPINNEKISVVASLPKNWNYILNKFKWSI